MLSTLLTVYIMINAPHDTLKRLFYLTIGVKNLTNGFENSIINIYPG